MLTSKIGEYSAGYVTLIQMVLLHFGRCDFEEINVVYPLR
jgi:hypothetical protein